jgi:hypothetical protein
VAASGRHCCPFPRACEPVERLTGRPVRAFISGIDTEVAGVSVETFLLHPRGSDAPSRGEADA